MSDAYHIILTRRALAHLEAIADHIFEDSPQNADAVAAAILHAINSLATMPQRFRRVSRTRRRKTAVHAMSVHAFIVYYRIDESRRAVHILHVVHGAQRPPRNFA